MITNKQIRCVRVNRFVGVEITSYKQLGSYGFIRWNIKQSKENFGISGRRVDLGNNGLKSQFTVIMVFHRCLSN
jgi:hypothetical protein